MRLFDDHPPFLKSSVYRMQTSSTDFFFVLIMIGEGYKALLM